VIQWVLLSQYHQGCYSRGDLFECCGAPLDVVVLLLSCFLPYPHHPHPPLIIALLLDLIMVLIFTFMFILIKPLCRWNGITWGLTLQLFTWILRSYITNSHSLQDITWSLFIIYKIKINLLLLRAISLIKHRITYDFNTTGVLVENMICVRV
jgi:hypothetical protein